MLSRALPALVLGSLIALVADAAADPNDLVMARLATRIANADGTPAGVVGQNLEFRALASQLGVALAPQLLTPADTLGFSGFQLSVAANQTAIDRKQAYWRARAGADLNGGSTGSDNLRTIGFFIRKGMWLPLPSFELGLGATHLIDSSMWTGQLYAKFALHEGYHDLPIPSLAVRGAVSRLISQQELDLTIASLDVTLSKHFGIGGTWRLDPYIGGNLLMIIPRSEVIDATPNIDSLAPGNELDAVNNFVFDDQSTIYRTRVLAGVKLQYSVVQFTIEALYAFKGTSLDDRAGTNARCQPNSMTVNCDAKDTAAAQTTISFSAGLDF